MKLVLQIASHKDGARSEPFVANPQELIDWVKENDEVDQDDYIIVLSVEEEDKISCAPLVTIKTLVTMHDIQFTEEQKETENVG